MPVPVDWDKSGRNDLLVSGESGMFYLFRRNYLYKKDKEVSYEIVY